MAKGKGGGPDCTGGKIYEGLAVEHRYLRTIRNLEFIPDDIKDALEGKFEPVSNVHTVALAKAAIAEKGVDASARRFMRLEKLNSVDVVIGQLLILEANKRNDFEAAVDIALKAAKHGTELGRAVQAMSIISRLSPEGALIFASRLMEKAPGIEGLKRKGERLTKWAGTKASDVEQNLNATRGKDEKVRKATLDILLKPIPERERRKLIDRVLELDAAGAFTQEKYREAVAKKLKLGVLDPEQAAKIHAKAMELQGITGQNARIEKEAELFALMIENVPVGTLAKIAGIQTMAQLLNFKTAVRNVLGNAIFGGIEDVSGVTATALDIGVSKITGKRSRVLPQSVNTAKNSLVRAAKAAHRDIQKGIDTSRTRSQYDLPRGNLFKNPALRALEKALNYELRASDRVFFEMAYRESLLNQVKAAKKSGKPLRITAEMQAVAHQDALYKTFQDDSALAKLFTGIKRTLNLEKDFGMGDFVLKYPKTPANLVSRAFAYTPAGFLKAIYEASHPFVTGKEFNQRAFVDSLGRAATGSVGIVAFGGFLGSLGIITGSHVDKDADMRDLQKQQGMGPNRINASAFMRFAMTLNPESAKWQANDVLYSYDWAQPISIPLAAGANLAAGHDAVDPGSSIESLITAVDTLTGQGLMRGIQDVTSARDEDGKTSITAGLINVIANAPSGFAPTAGKQVVDVLDNTARDTYDKDLITQSINKVKAKIPGLAQTLPAKVTSLGETDEKYQDGGNNIFNVMLNPGFVSRLKNDGVLDEIDAIYNESGETKQLPRVITKSVKITRKGKSETVDLDTETRQEMQRRVGQQTRRLYEGLIQDPLFKRLSAESKADVMGSVLTDVHTVEKMNTLGHQPETPSRAQLILRAGREDIYARLMRMKIINEKRSSQKTQLKYGT